ncbi:hypothetical protein ACFO3D_12395 [Virgibacillus kekensis]|uniref:Uncharacterized protein n=1 Tax=Virgibacillus kekensis TaxID=202261 RepID=A0ABV9DKP5_9BACI
MRKKQFIYINLTFFVTIVAFGLLSNLSLEYLTLVMMIAGICIIIYSIYRFFKKDLTASPIPLIQQIKEHEYQTMGRKWEKQQKSARIIQPFMGALLIIQAQLTPDFEHEPSGNGWFFLIPIVILAIAVNIALFIHTSKIDRVSSSHDFRREGWSAFAVGFGILILIAIILSIFIFSSILMLF